MRTEKEIFELVNTVAANDEKIRAVLLNGSRANPHHKTDRYSDFDIMFIVSDINSFLSDHSWINIFGERLMMQTPGDMMIPPSAKTADGRFAYLMLFTDFNRIDLTLFPIENIALLKPESLTRVLFDKDKLFTNLPVASNADYLSHQPSQKEFTDCCNEFWWVSTYVVKGLCRNEITYVKDMLEQPLRAMFMIMLTWLAGVKDHFPVDAGKSEKYLRRYFDQSYWNKVMNTYPNADVNEIWKSLLLMTELFRDAARKVAVHLNFNYNAEEDNNVKRYLMTMKDTRS